jgi:hypothetical protein
MSSRRPRKQVPAPITNLDAADLGPLAATVAVLVANVEEYERRREAAGNQLTLRDVWAHAAFAAIGCEEELQRLTPTDRGAIAPQLRGSRHRVNAVLDLHDALRRARAAGAWSWGPGPDVPGPLPPAPNLSRLLVVVRSVAGELVDLAGRKGEGPADLDFLPGGIRCGGQTVDLSGKPLACVRALYDAHHRRLHWRTLRDRVWGTDAYTEKNAIKNAIKDARDALRRLARKMGRHLEADYDPLPHVDQGENLAWELNFPR